MPKRSSKAAIRACGMAAPPDTQKRTEAHWFQAWSSTRNSRLYMLGTPRKTVAPCAAMAALTSLGSNWLTITNPRLWSKGVSMPTVAAKAWNRGSTTSTRSRPGSNTNACRILVVFTTKLVWLSMAPLGRPVVPDV